MTRQQIIDRVKIKMEEVTPFDEGLAVSLSDVKPFLSYIEENMQNSLDELLLICPIHLTTPVNIPQSKSGTSLFTTTLDNHRMVGSLVIPTDFIRLHTFKMSSWERPVNRPISIENPEYKNQFNRWGRGGNAKPIVAKNSTKLEIYTFDQGATIQTALYVARIDTQDNFDMNEKLFDPLCSLIAANVFGIFGSQQQKVMLQEVDNFIKSEL